MGRRKAPHIPDALLDQLLARADAKTAFEADGLLDSLKKALTERALNAEMDHHLADAGDGNSRNGYGRKTVTTDGGKLEPAIPRDRQPTFDPQRIAKYQRRFPGFDEKIISMYARGMSVRKIVGHLRNFYGVDVSPDLICTGTDAVLEEVAAWQARPLEPVYPLVFFDALRVKNRRSRRSAGASGAPPGPIEETVIMRLRPHLPFTADKTRLSFSMRRADILVDDWSDERLKHEEVRLFLGFHVGGDKTPELDPGDGLGLVFPTAARVATAPPVTAEPSVNAARPAAASRPAATEPADAVVTVPQAATIPPARRGGRSGGSG